MNIGERIKQRRIELGLSVDEVAERLGKNRATVYRYENGGIENLPTTILEPLSKVLETTPAELMGFQQESNIAKNIVIQGYINDLMELPEDSKKKRFILKVLQMPEEQFESFLGALQNLLN